MPKKAKETTSETSVLIIVRKPGCEKWREYIEDSWFSDHIFFLTPEDLCLWPPIPSPLNHYVGDQCESATALQLLRYRFPFSAKISQLNICIDSGSSELVKSILCNLEGTFSEEPTLSVSGCEVTNDLLAKSLNFAWVTFNDCEFSEDWWLTDTSEAKTTLLHIINCRGKLPDPPVEGQLGWPMLETFYVWERRYSFETRRQEQVRFEHLAEYDTDHAFTAALLTSLWHKGIKSMLLNNCRSTEFLTSLNASEELNDIDLSGTPVSDSSLAWICRNTSIRYLGLAWRNGERPDWSRLRGLKGLRTLEVVDSLFDDEDLESLRKNKIPLIRLQAYYTALTAKSWRTILTYPTLRSLTVSQHALQGDLPAELPEHTKLKEVVALNTRYEDFVRFLARWPNVEVVEM